MQKEGNELCIIYPLIYGSVLIVLIVRVTKQHPVNISFLKKLVHVKQTYACCVLDGNNREQIIAHFKFRKLM